MLKFIIDIILNHDENFTNHYIFKKTSFAPSIEYDIYLNYHRNLINLWIKYGK